MNLLPKCDARSISISFQARVEEQLEHIYSPCMRARVVDKMPLYFAAMQILLQMECVQDVTSWCDSDVGDCLEIPPARLKRHGAQDTRAHDTGVCCYVSNHD